VIERYDVRVVLAPGKPDGVAAVACRAFGFGVVGDPSGYTVLRRGVDGS
jgi:hypothetical protein